MAKEAPKANLPTVAEDKEAPPKKAGKLKKIVILVVILLIIGSAGGGVAYWWFFLRVPPAPDEAEPVVASGQVSSSAAHGEKKADGKAPAVAPAKPGVGKVLPLPNFVVNLADSGSKRLRLNMEVEVNADIGKELQANNAKIRDAVITLLAGKSFAEVQSPEGKVMLRAQIVARLNQILGAQRIIRVYFTDFVLE